MEGSISFCYAIWWSLQKNAWMCGVQDYSSTLIVHKTTGRGQRVDARKFGDKIYRNHGQLWRQLVYGTFGNSNVSNGTHGKHTQLQMSSQLYGLI